jgi:hypothetical protein
MSTYLIEYQYLSYNNVANLTQKIGELRNRHSYFCDKGTT